jgi:hypothetical protein
MSQFSCGRLGRSIRWFLESKERPWAAAGMMGGDSRVNWVTTVSLWLPPKTAQKGQP